MGKEMIERIEDMEECLIKFMDAQFADGVQCLAEGNNCMIAGQIIDMIKDLADAKKNCYKAKYYETVTEAMEDFGEDEEDGRYGYNGRRMANGRYASTGQGRPGYGRTMMPYPHMMDEPDEWNDHMRMGYTPTGMGNRSQSGNNSYGRSFDEYRNAKRNYTETRSPSDKQMMDDSAREHVNHAIGTLKEINETADDQLRMRMRTDLTNLINQLN